MINYECDLCHAKVNEYGLSPIGQSPRTMYQLQVVMPLCDEENGSFEGYVICRKCMSKINEEKLRVKSNDNTKDISRNNRS